MHNYSVSEKYALLEKINGSFDQLALLDLLGAEIEKLGAFDGYLINMLHVDGMHLESLKVRFTAAFRELEQTYQGYKVSLAGLQPNVSVRAFKTQQTIRADIDNGTPEEKALMELWKLQEIAALPLTGWENDQPTNPVGTVLLLKQEGHIDPLALEKVDELIALFHKPLVNARQLAFLQNYHDRFEAAAAEQARFLQFIVDMNNITSPDRVYDMFSNELFHQLQFDVVGFFLQEGEKLVAKKIAVNDPTLEEKRKKWQRYLAKHDYQLTTTDGGVSHTFLRNTPLVFPDVQKIMNLPMSDKDRKTMEIFDNIYTLLILPIRFQQQPIGVITFFSIGRQLPVTDSDMLLLNNLSAFFGTAITNGRNMQVTQQQHQEIERLNEMLQEKVKELAEQASTDKLTGLSNFRSFEQELGRRINESERRSDKEGLSIAVIDIDHFKKFNDNYGHQAGNIVLAGVAKEIAKLARKMDLACRYGGEEFVVILARCDIDGARIFAERLRIAIEKTSFETDAGILSVTVSIGCATHLQSDNNQSLFNRADQALYRAKNNGRNRVEVV
ncbi:MAG: sensor domain-containing diguanylate cyclase [Proteobacteria bacterium]|nr:sensor domain-containing diguanylate cyclase [Pseudomonadota bacterium]